LFGAHITCIAVELIFVTVNQLGTLVKVTVGDEHDVEYPIFIVPPELDGKLIGELLFNVIEHEL